MITLFNSLTALPYRCYAHATSLVTKAFLAALSPPTKTAGKRNADQLEDEKDEDEEDDIQRALDNIDQDAGAAMDGLDDNNNNYNDNNDDSLRKQSKALRTLLLKIRGLVAKVCKSPQAKAFFRQCCGQTDNGTKAKELIPFCKTQWETWEMVMGRLLDLKR